MHRVNSGRWKEEKEKEELWSDHENYFNDEALRLLLSRKISVSFSCGICRKDREEIRIINLKNDHRKKHCNYQNRRKVDVDLLLLAR